MTMHEFNRDDGFNQRLLQEFYDSYDEELEMELDDLRFDAAEVDSDAKKAWRKQYFRELLRLQGELVKLQDWVMRTGHRLVILFEGRDAAGKGGVINASPSVSTRAPVAWRRCRRRTTANAPSGIFSAISRICPPPAKWCCSTAAGITAPAWNA